MTTCHHCGQPCRPATGAEIYPHRPDLHAKRFYICENCEAWVGCHANGLPLGTAANKELRGRRRQCHEMFDSMWRDKTHFRSRTRAYNWLHNVVGVGHFSHMGVAECLRALEMMERKGCQA